MHGRRRSSREQQWALPATIQTVLEGDGDWDERTHTVWAQYAPGRGMAGGDQGHATARAIDAYQLGRDTVTLIIVANGSSLMDRCPCHFLHVRLFVGIQTVWIQTCICISAWSSGVLIKDVATRILRHHNVVDTVHIICMIVHADCDGDLPLVAIRFSDNVCVNAVVRRLLTQSLRESVHRLCKLL